MSLQDWITREVINVVEDASIREASNFVKENGNQHLPVNKRRCPMGIIFAHSLKQAQPFKTTTPDMYELYHLPEKVDKNIGSPMHL